MASFDGAYPSLIQGVSQQVPTSRLDGQVTEQINMVSDLVTGIRRRTGARHRFTMHSDGATHNYRAWRTDVGGVTAEFFLNLNTGSLKMLEDGKDPSTALEFQSDYLKAERYGSIRFAGVGDSLFIANVEKVPNGVKDPTHSIYKVGGYLQVQGSALRQKFTIKVQANGKTYTGEFTTPSGEASKHTAWVTTEYIAERLLASLRGEKWVLPDPIQPPSGSLDPIVYPDPEITVDPTTYDQYFDSYLEGNTLYIQSKEDASVTITTDTGRIYINTSNAGRVRDVGDLPARLPESADGLIMEVGRVGSDPTYFKYNNSSVIWEETAHPDSFTGITNMPIELYYDGTDWVLDDTPYLGRLTGDAETNPDPDFVGWGITGICSFQSRLVILTGSWVWMSATNTPRQFYRKTVSDLLDTDPIGIGSSSASSASFYYGVLFNKDLILFSPEHQAIIQGLNQAVTPKTAHIVVTSTYTADMSTNPVTLGSSIMYPMPRSSTHFGLMEMIPSSYSDSMYSSVDASEHIPTYLKGRCRFAVSSTVGSLVVFGSTNTLRELYVHEYLWAGEEKVLRAWHKWEFSFDITTAYFSGGLINVVGVDPKTGLVTVSSLDPKEGEGSNLDARKYYLDHNIVLDVVRDESGVYVTLPVNFKNYIEGYGLEDCIRVVYYGTALDSTEIGATWAGDKMILNSSTTAKKVVLGVPYVSTLIPTPPVIKDYRDRPIVFSKMQLIKMYIRTDTSGGFSIEIQDTARRGQIDYTVNPLKWYSTDLSLGRLPVGGVTGSVIPCRVDTATSEVIFRSEGLNEFNILNLEYTCKSSATRARR